MSSSFSIGAPGRENMGRTPARLTFTNGYTLCRRCLNQRDGEWQRAVREGTLAIVCVLDNRTECSHCGR